MAGFQVQEDDNVIDHPATAAKETTMATQLMLLSLKALSQRALVAASAIFTGAGLFSAWWLWQSVLPAPTVYQLVGVTLYAVFFLALEFIRRR